MYVVLCADRSLYCGVTTDLTRRLHEHNSSSRGAKYTRARRPVTLVYQEPHSTRSTAQSAEARFKRLSRAKKLEVISKTHQALL